MGAKCVNAVPITNLGEVIDWKIQFLSVVILDNYSHPYVTTRKVCTPDFAVNVEMANVKQLRQNDAFEFHLRWQI